MKYQDYAKFAKLSYEKASERKLDDLGLNDWNIDNLLSNDRRLVLVNPDNKQVVFAMRGTDITNKKDLLTDVGIGVGVEKKMGQYKRANRTIRHIKNKYPDYNLSLTGHSMSALYAYNLGKKYDLESYSFNPPSSIPTNITTTVGNWLVNAISKPSKQKLYYVATDPIGFLGTTGLRGDVNYVKRKVKNPHSLENFL